MTTPGTPATMATRVLLTGAGGFIGSHVVRALLRGGIEVRGVLRPGEDRANLAGLDLEQVEADVQDRSKMLAAARGCHWIFHLAALNVPWAPDPRLFHDINVGGTANLLEAARQAGTQRFVYTSTCNFWPGRPDGRPITEEDPIPGSVDDDPYTATKYVADHLVCQAAELGLFAILVAPTVPVGPGDIHGTPFGKFLGDVLAGRLRAYLDAQIDLVPVEDCGAAHILAAQRGTPGRRYILGGELWSLGRVLQVVQGVSGVRAPRLRVPFAVAYAFALLDEVRARLTGRPAKTSPAWVRRVRHPRRFDSTRARSELGYAPGPVRPALERAVEWFRSRKALVKTGLP